MIPDVFRVKDLADFLHISRSTVGRYLRSGTLPYSKIGNIIYIKSIDVVSFIESHKIAVQMEKISDEILEISNPVGYNKHTQTYVRPDGK